ncbi:hypothetical protein BDY21DRAFT_137585 [Lineolata rhizophorae]|uniref:Uncharacterized protein n=1 Tax=Lineolata rhizophorae TaxID=578093 RepID=A0A6A6PAQ5_9PEZI|nr:hypothetical protein BDY21DRAFT_137585 [Lineolata rhizophorae]
MLIAASLLKGKASSRADRAPPPPAHSFCSSPVRPLSITPRCSSRCVWPLQSYAFLNAHAVPPALFAPAPHSRPCPQSHALFSPPPSPNSSLRTHYVCTSPDSIVPLISARSEGVSARWGVGFGGHRPRRPETLACASSLNPSPRETPARLLLASSGPRQPPEWQPHAHGHTRGAAPSSGPRMAHNAPGEGCPAPRIPARNKLTGLGAGFWPLWAEGLQSAALNGERFARSGLTVACRPLDVWTEALCCSPPQQSTDIIATMQTGLRGGSRHLFRSVCARHPAL